VDELADRGSHGRWWLDWMPFSSHCSLVRALDLCPVDPQQISTATHVSR